MPKNKLETFSDVNYHKEYYKKNKELIRAKRLLSKGTIVNEAVKQWKINKMNDEWAFYPFYDPSNNIRYCDECSEPTFEKVEPNTECGTASAGSTPSNTEGGTSSTSITSKDAL